MTDPLGDNSGNPAKKQEKSVFKPNQTTIINVSCSYYIIIIIIIYHDFLPTPGGVVMSSQVNHTHSHQDTPLSPYT